MQISDDLFLGPALGPQPSGVGLMPSPMERGVGPMGRVYLFDLVPLTLQATGLAATQAVSGVTSLVLTAGTGVTRSTAYDGSLIYTMDCARCVTLVSTNAGDTTQVATVVGFDFYGAPMTATITLNGTTTVVTLKAFKSVKSITISATTTGTVSAGFNDRLGLPVRVTDAVYLARVGWNATLAENAGTFVAAVTTDPATAATGDVRGLYTPSSAADGTKRLVMAIMMPALACGPNATRAGAYGVTQF